MAATSKQLKMKGLIIIIISLALIIHPGSSSGQSSDTTSFEMSKAAYYLPVRTASGKFQHAFSLTNNFLPSDWTLLAVSAPMFNYQARYGLPAGFQIDAFLSTVFVSNRIMLGPRWTYSKNNWHYGLSYHQGYNFGFLNDFGFEVTVTAWSHIPGLAVGYSFDKTSLTLKASLEYLGNFSYYTGDNVIENKNFRLNGSTVGLILEQRLWKDRIFSLAFEMNHVNFVMQAWPAFPINNKTYFVPSVTWGIVF